jgi:prevent-host-death family protein
MDKGTCIEPVTTLKTKSAQLIKKARTAGQPIFITQNGRPSAVLQDIDSYREQRQTLLLLRFLVEGDRQLQEGKGISHTRAKAHFRKTIQGIGNA